MIWVYFGLAISLSFISGYCIGALREMKHLGGHIDDSNCEATYHPLQFPSKSPQYPTKSKDDKNS